MNNVLKSIVVGVAMLTIGFAMQVHAESISIAITPDSYLVSSSSSDINQRLMLAYSECEYRCEQAWLQCNKTCRMSIYGDVEECYRGCDADKRVCLMGCY